MIVDFEPDHLLQLRFQKDQQGFGAQTRSNAESVAQGWSQKTAFLTPDQPLACAGISELWPGRAMAWAALDYDAGPVLREITKACRVELDRCPYKRIEMYVRPGVVAAVKWAKMLGFELESRMQYGAPDGTDLLVYVRFKRSRAVRELLWNSQ